jgi:predicted RNA-binding protein Jag
MTIAMEKAGCLVKVDGQMLQVLAELVMVMVAAAAAMAVAVAMGVMAGEHWSRPRSHLRSMAQRAVEPGQQLERATSHQTRLRLSPPLSRERSICQPLMTLQTS